MKTAQDNVNSILTESITDPIKKRFYTILNTKNYKKENYIKEKSQAFQIKKDDIVLLIDGRRAKVIKNSSNSTIHIGLFDENGMFTEETDVISKSDIDKIES